MSVQDLVKAFSMPLEPLGVNMNVFGGKILVLIAGIIGLLLASKLLKGCIKTLVFLVIVAIVVITIVL